MPRCASITPTWGCAVIKLLVDPALRQRVGAAARAAFEREQGGVLRTVEVVEKVLGARETKVEKREA